MKYSNYLQAIIAAYVPICRSADMPVVGHRHVGIAKLISQYCNAINHSIYELGSGQHSNHIPQVTKETCCLHLWQRKNH